MTQLINLHDDMIHDAVLDYYGRRLATCSSDRTIKIYEVEGETHRLVETLKGHDGPVWQVSWAHPKYGNILASASYDGKVIIWQEKNGAWGKLTEHTNHQASVNSVQWAPHEVGAVLACASSDGKVSVLEFKEDGSWDVKLIQAHAIGCNAVAWAPATTPGSIVQTSGSAPNASSVRRFVTGGSDNLLKIWNWNAEVGQFLEETQLEGHSDWVRDVAWAPSILPKSYIASASQDKTAIIWTSTASVNGEPAQWAKKVLQFDNVVWRVSWSLSGNALAVSGGDNKVTVWKENLKGEWEKARVEESV
ncbi:WD40 repeat-like protein [Terfezia boudieri ATCC MYA-4762]|uniref:Protein transport protein SEC13 n=1 Tax=Terfezia boudieri ATCC MYA-4762 TaxID=1051890 RepID=A0A3N4LEX0_9PEZI|nr:WD40 repeat-like protein [Terfezia boudieri ATCC MYA-4762]